MTKTENLSYLEDEITKVRHYLIAAGIDGDEGQSYCSDLIEAHKTASAALARVTFDLSKEKLRHAGHVYVEGEEYDRLCKADRELKKVNASPYAARHMVDRIDKALGKGFTQRLADLL